MALSSHADSGQQRTEHDKIEQYLTDNNSAKYSTGFVPNPAAKPFVPAETNNFNPSNGMQLKWQKHTDPGLSTSYQRKPCQSSVNGMEEPTNGFHLRFLQQGATSPSLSHSSPNAEEEVPPLMIPPCDNEQTCENEQSKKHIAFHLLSTVLDDEILEDQGEFPLTTNGQEQHNGNPRYGRSESWPVNSASLSSSFNLSLDLHDNSAPPPAGLGNRIIHEIWSPKPSPRDSYPSTPSEEGMPYFQNNTDPFDTSMNKSDIDQRISPSENAIIGSAPTSMANHVTESPPYAAGFEDYYCKDRARSLPHSLRSSQEPFKQHRSHNNQSNMHQNHYMKRVNSANGYINDPHDYRKAYVYNGMSQPIIHNSRPMNGIIKHHNGHGKEYGEVFRVHAAEKLGCCLDDCLDQLRNLERECRKAEQELSKVYPPRRPSSSGSSHMPRLPPNPTRVDRMIVDQTKEHNKVESLIGRIERLSRSPMHSNVGVALDQWLACIKELQMTRKDEIANSHNSSGYGSKSYAVKDLLALSHVVQDLFGHTRSARAIVCCAMQMLHVDDDWLYNIENNSNLERSLEKS